MCREKLTPGQEHPFRKEWKDFPITWAAIHLLHRLSLKPQALLTHQPSQFKGGAFPLSNSRIQEA